jgi:hypothetical protein
MPVSFPKFSPVRMYISEAWFAHAISITAHQEDDEILKGNKARCGAESESHPWLESKIDP